MAVSNWEKGRLLRTEFSGNLDGNQSNGIFKIEYDQDLDDDVTHFQDGNEIPNIANTEVLFTNKPLIIKEYKITVASNDLVMVHQYYGDKADPLEYWNTTNAEFHRGLKQYKMVPGGKQVYPIEWQADSLPLNVDGVDVTETAHSNNYAVRTIHFDTDYIKRKGKKGYYKNNLRPIVLSKNKGNMFGFTVSNISGNDDAFFYAFVEIKRWSTLT